jgi:hypothetical protein
VLRENKPALKSIPVLKSPVGKFKIGDEIKIAEQQLSEAPPLEISSQPIDIPAFESAFEQLKQQIQTQNASLAAALNNLTYTIQENRWCVVVHSAFDYTLITGAKDKILSQLREQTQNPTILIEITQLTTNAENIPIPMTDENRRRQMEEKNPAFARFQQLFNTIISYERY